MVKLIRQSAHTALATTAVQAALGVLACLALAACSATRGTEAPEAYLTPTGWQSLDNTLPTGTFSDYADAVRDEVDRFRIPFDSANALQEADWAAPIELLPEPACGNTLNGIAILVHGLSDTAFAMRDAARVLASQCYRARTVLLPGHGTRAGDLLTTRHAHWRNTVQYAIDQASAEHDHVVVVGYSLGAVLTLNEALKNNDTIDAVIAFSPAYHLSAQKLARWAPLMHPIVRWVDRGIADDAMRYEAMPTRGVAETVRAMRALNKTLAKSDGVTQPWLMIQSMDDAVVRPVDNNAFFDRHAKHPLSQRVNLFSNNAPDAGTYNPKREHWIPGFSDELRVRALTHLAVHISPDNPHYGPNGAYRNCGGTGPTEASVVALCENSDNIEYGLWRDLRAGQKPTALATFNPQFDEVAAVIKTFLTDVHRETWPVD